MRTADWAAQADAMAAASCMEPEVAAEQAWRKAREQLAQLESLRDAQGGQMAAMEEPCAPPGDAPVACEVMSAA